MKRIEYIVSCSMLITSLAAPLFAADGTWTADANGNWSDTTKWSGGTVADGAGFTATLDNVITATRTVTLDSGRTIGNITAADTSNDFIISGGNTLTLDAGTPTIHVPQSGRELTITSVIAGTAGITKTGSGRLNITGANTFTGGLVVNAGHVGENGANGLSTIALNNNDITVNGDVTIIFKGGTTTTGGITLNNASVLTTGNNNSSITIGGAVTGSGGIKIIKVGDGANTIYLNNAANTFTGGVDFASGRRIRLYLNSFTDTGVPGTGNISFSVARSAYDHEFILNSGFSAPLTLDNRQFDLGSPSETDDAVIRNNSAQAFTINSDLIVSGTGAKPLTLGGTGAGTSTFAGSITNGSGIVALTKADSGTWVLTGSNTYSGGTTVSAGTLVADGTNALGIGNVTVTGGTLDIQTPEAISSNVSLALPSESAVNLNVDADTYVAELYINGIRRPSGVYTAAGAGSGWMSGTATLYVGGDALYWDIDGATSGAGGATPSQTWDTTTANWTTSYYGNSASTTWGPGLTAGFAASNDASGTYTVTVSGTPTIGGISFEEGTVTVTGGTALQMIDDSFAYVDSGLNATIASVISEDATPRQLTTGGAGTLSLSGNNTHSGGTRIIAGTTIGAGDGALGAGNVDIDGGLLRLTHTSALDSATSFALAETETLQLRYNSAATFNSPLLEAYSTGGNSFTIDVNNNGSGTDNTLTLGGGLWSRQAHGNVASLNITGGNGYSLRLTELVVDRFNGGGAGGGFTLNPTTASLTVDAATATNLNSTVDLILNGTATGNSIGPVSDTTGNLSLQVAGGEWTLTGANSHDDFTQLSGGVMILANANALGTVNFNISGGNLDSSIANLVNAGNNAQTWSGNWAYIGSLGATGNLDLGTGAVTLTKNCRVTVSNSLATLTVGGVISGGGCGIIKMGDGTLKLSGANTFTGEAMAYEGTLALTNGNAVADNTSLVIANTGKVRLDTDETVNMLFIDGDLMESGTWGSSASGAANTNNAWFSGTNVLTVSTGSDYMDLLIRDDFESGFGSWTAEGNAGSYTYSSGTDYSTTFDSAGRMTDGRIFPTQSLQLDTMGYTNVTISYNIRWNGPSGTRRIKCRYKTDASTTNEIGTSDQFDGRVTYNASESTYTFNDESTLHIQMYDSGGPVVYADDVLILASPAYPIITNSPVADVTSVSATFNATISRLAGDWDIYAYWGETDGTNNPASWTNSALVGSWTDALQSTNISFSTNGLTPSTQYYCTFWASNASLQIWASPSESFVTIDSPVVNNSSGATSDSITSATLRGLLASGGVAQAWICWGSADGGVTSTGDWDNVASVGSVTQSVEFSSAATGLDTNATYWYRCYVTNSLGSDWSDDADTFSGTPTSTSGGGSGYSMEITFTNFAGMGTLTNFPALVRFTMSNINNYEGFLDTTNGWDLRFWTNSALTGTELNYEIESFDTNTNSYVWVQIPKLTNNISIWASWGDSGNTNQEAYTTNGAVWSEGYVGVWHMSEPNAQDSTTNNNHGTASGNADVLGQVNGAQDLSDSADTITVGNTGVNTYHSVLWVKLPVDVTSGTGNQTIMNFSSSYSLRFGGVTSYLTGETLTLVGPNVGGWQRTGIFDVLASGWRNIAITRVGSSYEIYVDGEKKSTTSNQIAADLMPASNVSFPCDNLGFVDEARISTVSRSSNWIWACWMNQGTNHDSFVEYGDPQSGAAIANLAPTNITETTAALNASLNVAAGTNYAVYVHFGATDGGTNFGWNAGYVLADAVTNSTSTNETYTISYPRSGLQAGTAYWYTFRASNDAGNVWASPSWTFTTALPTGLGSVFMFK